jgi:hypothetical protein
MWLLYPNVTDIVREHLEDTLRIWDVIMKDGYKNITIRCTFLKCPHEMPTQTLQPMLNFRVNTLSFYRHAQNTQNKQKKLCNFFNYITICTTTWSKSIYQDQVKSESESIPSPSQFRARVKRPSHVKQDEIEENS